MIHYNPEKLSFSEILEIFWAEHDPASKSWSKQYRPVIFYRGEQQKKLALDSKTELEKRLKKKVYTEILPAGEFYPAEVYHQKYYLRRLPALLKVLNEVYSQDADLVTSTVSARINGYLGGYGNLAELEKELASAGLTEGTIEKISGILKKSGRH